MPEPKTTREKLTVSIDPPVRDALERHAAALVISPAAYARHVLHDWARQAPKEQAA